MSKINLSEKTAIVDYCLSVLEKYGLVEKRNYDGKDKQFKFGLTEEAEGELQGLVKKHKGNKSLACMELLLSTIAKGEKNAKTLQALGVYLQVLHVLAFNKLPDKGDAT